MSTESLPVVPKSEHVEILASQYGIGPSYFANTLHGLYQRHLLFDNGVDPAITNAREHYEAFARSVRDILSQRWVLTHRTYHNVNPKRIYYLSMEFLIGRSLANNVTNLMCSIHLSRAPLTRRLARSSSKRARQQYEIHDERCTDHRYPRWRHD